MDKKYSVKALADLAGVSVRTLHHYDRIGLLKPEFRTDGGYRMYGKDELLRLLQILFYKELDFELKKIAEILDDPGFDLLSALNGHREKLIKRKSRIDGLLKTIDRTIEHLKNKTKMNYESLYDGIPKEKARAWRKEALERWPDEVRKSEAALLKMAKPDFEKLKNDFADCWETLAGLKSEDPTSDHVQKEIYRHYRFIRQFWGTVGEEDLQAEPYAGLGNMYVSDERYTSINGEPDPVFAGFMQKAMRYFADTRLK